MKLIQDNIEKLRQYDATDLDVPTGPHEDFERYAVATKRRIYDTQTCPDAVLTSISLSGCDSVQIGNVCTLVPVCRDQYADIINCPTLEYYSRFGNTTISQSGEVTGIIAGYSIIGVYDSITGVYAEKYVSVTDYPVLTSIATTPAIIPIQIGTVQQLTAICSDQYGKDMTCPTLTWSSSNPSIATVDQSGIVTGIAEGSTSITADASGITSNVSVIAVTIPTPVLTSITISPASASIQVGTVQQLSVICSDQYGSVFICPTLTWSSSNPSVATVDQYGIVTGVTEGSSNIIATSSGVTSNTSVTTVILYPSVLTSIAIIPTIVPIQIGTTQQLTAICSDQYGKDMTCPTLTWSSSNPSIATVDQFGLVTGMTEGSSSITTTTSGVTSGTSVTMVTTPPSVLTSIEITPTIAQIQIGTSQQLTAICSDQYGKNMTCPILTWSSSNPSMATVDQSGLVTGMTEGSSSITATASGVTSDTSVITVTILPPVLTTITISPASTSIQIGATQQLSVTCSDQYGAVFTCPILTWSSSDPSVATVDQSGLVTSIVEGSSSITATVSGVTSGASVIMVTIPPATEASIGGIAVIGLAFGALLMGRKKG